MKAIILSLAIAFSGIVAYSAPAKAFSCYYNIVFQKTICE